MTAESFPHLKITGGRLTATKELPFHGRELEMACRQLFDSDEPRLVIDLGGLGYVASPQIGALVAACARAAETGRSLRILVSPALVRFLERMKVDGMMDYEVVENPGE